MLSFITDFGLIPSISSMRVLYEKAKMFFATCTNNLQQQEESVMMTRWCRQVDAERIVEGSLKTFFCQNVSNLLIQQL